MAGTDSNSNWVMARGMEGLGHSGGRPGTAVVASHQLDARMAMTAGPPTHVAAFLRGSVVPHYFVLDVLDLGRRGAAQQGVEQ